MLLSVLGGSKCLPVKCCSKQDQMMKKHREELWKCRSKVVCSMHASLTLSPASCFGVDELLLLSSLLF